ERVCGLWGSCLLYCEKNRHRVGHAAAGSNQGERIGPTRRAAAGSQRKVGSSGIGNDMRTPTNTCPGSTLRSIVRKTYVSLELQGQHVSGKYGIIAARDCHGPIMIIHDEPEV